MLVMVQQVIVQDDQSLDGLLHRCQLHQRHLPVLPVMAGEVTSSNTALRGAQERGNMRAAHDWFPALTPHYEL